VNFNSPFINFNILFLLLFGFLTSTGCNKEMSSIGLKDRNDLLNATFTDSTTLYAYSVVDDSLITIGLRSNILGSVVDEVFGITTSSIYTQLIPEGDIVNFGEAPELDSIVLTLRYTGAFFGDTLNPFAIKVYELTEEISSKDTFYSNSSIANTGMDLVGGSNFLLYPRPTSKVKLDTVYEPHIRIRLDDELGRRFLQNPSNMASAETFKNFFKGINICAEPDQSRSNGSLVNVALENALSGIQLYYKDKNVAKKFSFVIKTNTETIRFNNYHHEYEKGNPDFVRQTLEKDTLLGAEVLYLQSMGGVKTKITFPYIKALKGKRMVINKAELVITKIDERNDLYQFPRQLSLQGINKEGKLVNIPDAGTGATYFGGSYDSSKKEFRFRISRYIQDVISRDNFEPSIYLVISGAATSANRILIQGHAPFDASSRIRLEIYYTEY
jgi:hypothetical protein